MLDLARLPDQVDYGGIYQRKTSHLSRRIGYLSAWKSSQVPSLSHIPAEVPDLNVSGLLLVLKRFEKI